ASSKRSIQACQCLPSSSSAWRYSSCSTSRCRSRPADCPGRGSVSIARTAPEGGATGEWSGSTACAPVGAATPPAITTACASRCSKSGRGLGIARLALIACSSLRHVAGPGAELVAHGRFGGAVVGIRDAVFLAVVAVPAVEADPVQPPGLQAPLRLGPVLQVVG